MSFAVRSNAIKNGRDQGTRVLAARFDAIFARQGSPVGAWAVMLEARRANG